jgi:hypothetical protein
MAPEKVKVKQYCFPIDFEPPTPRQVAHKAVEIAGMDWNRMPPSEHERLTALAEARPRCSGPCSNPICAYCALIQEKVGTAKGQVHLVEVDDE